MWLQNGNGVYLRLKARRQGLALSLGGRPELLPEKSLGNASRSRSRFSSREESQRLLFLRRSHTAAASPVRTNDRVPGSGTASVPEKKNGSISPVVLIEPDFLTMSGA